MANTSFVDPESTIEGVFQEWIATNMFGGYASSTMGLVNTRTYHGLLTSSSITGGNRVQLVNALEEKVVLGGEEYYLSTHRYTDVYYPDGLKHLSGFGWDEGGLWWAYRIGPSMLLKHFTFERAKEGFTVEYRATQPFTLEVTPLLSFRTHHSVVRAGQKTFSVTLEADGSIAVNDGVLPLTLKLAGGEFRREEHWYYNFYYEEEARRGGPTTEDLYSPGKLVAAGQKLVVEAWVEPSKTIQRETGRTPLQSYLAFNPHPLIVAGYHWFWDWCRDTMIVLPTLLEETGDLATTERILERYFEAMDQGFLPTGFGEDGKPFYNSVDTSLWAAYAIQRVCGLTSNLKLAYRFQRRLEEVYEGYTSGSMFGVRFVDGLLYHAAKGATWMDAYYEGVYYTPRDGFAVEVNALWLLLLKLLCELGGQTQEEVERFKASFNRAFRSEFGLYDTLNAEMKPADPGEVRPNMLFALSLHHDLVDGATAAKVLETTRRHLLTPYGLRTLNPQHPLYRPRYLGDRASRDAAYHNGTVWPWLVGAYTDACLNFDRESLPYTRYTLEPLFRHAEKNRYLVNEVFDAQPPHTPRGCIAQAWSTSEIIRVKKLLKSN